MAEAAVLTSIYLHLPADLLLYVPQPVTDHLTITASGSAAVFDLDLSILTDPLRVVDPVDIDGFPASGVIYFESERLGDAYSLVEYYYHVY